MKFRCSYNLIRPSLAWQYSSGCMTLSKPPSRALDSRIAASQSWADPNCFNVAEISNEKSADYGWSEEEIRMQKRTAPTSWPSWNHAGDISTVPGCLSGLVVGWKYFRHVCQLESFDPMDTIRSKVMQSLQIWFCNGLAAGRDSMWLTYLPCPWQNLRKVPKKDMTMQICHDCWSLLIQLVCKDRGCRISHSIICCNKHNVKWWE